MMLMTYSKCLEIYKSAYQINKAVKEQHLYKIEKGVYSETKSVSELAVITCKYPNAVITMNSAFFYYGLTDTIPESYYIATPKSAHGIRDPRIKQIYTPEQIFELGVTTMQHWDASIKIYDRERMLVELMRFKNVLPYDYYKEIVINYRDIVYDLDIQRIEEYATTFPKSKMILAALQSEVF